MNKILIGIDADVDKSGVSILYKIDGHKDKLTIYKMRFFDLLECLKFEKERPDQTVKVYIEAGWKNLKSNWHVSGKGEAVSARVGTKVGANHQVGKLIAEMCEYLGLEYELVQPRTSKMPVKLFRKITGYEGKVDQDGIDACMLIFGR